MAAAVGLGYSGIYGRDLEKILAFYRDTLGIRMTKQNGRAGIVFFNTDPKRADHQIALFRGAIVRKHSGLLAAPDGYGSGT